MILSVLLCNTARFFSNNHLSALPAHRTSETSQSTRTSLKGSLIMQNIPTRDLICCNDGTEPDVGMQI